MLIDEAKPLQGQQLTIATVSSDAAGTALKSNPWRSYKRLVSDNTGTRRLPDASPGLNDPNMTWGLQDKDLHLAGGNRLEVTGSKGSQDLGGLLGRINVIQSLAEAGLRHLANKTRKPARMSQVTQAVDRWGTIR